MSDALIRTKGRAGRITLNRPGALNALSHAMCLEIEAALDRWRDDPAVALVLIDAEGERAFCSGGDIAQVYHAGRAGDYALGQGFWRDEYRMNAKLSEYPKPIVSFLHGFVMGGGVGLGCHVTQRVVGESTQMAMPECGIGLVPDVGGTLLLARAPGHLGAYLGLTGARMGPADAIYAGFADLFVPQADWPAVKTAMAEGGRADLAGVTPPQGRLEALQDRIDAHFGHATVEGILASLRADPSDFAAETLKVLSRNSPLSMACTLALIRAVRPGDTIRDALRREYRFTHRSMEQGDFLEGVRAQIIDKDRTPRWRHASPADLAEGEAAALIAPLGAQDLDFKEPRT